MAKCISKDNSHQEASSFVQYGYEYIEAARLVDSEIGGQDGFEFVSPTPAYFLAMHGIELTLKAFLRYQGLTTDQIRKSYGHDLRKSYRKAKELGLLDVFKVDTGDSRAIVMLMRLNQDHGLRYKKSGWKRYPSWAIVEPLAVRLHQAIAPLVGCKTFRVTFTNYKSKV